MKMKILQRTEDNTKLTPVIVPPSTFALLSEHLEVLYRNIAIDRYPAGRIIGDYYRGHSITWKELALAYDAPRQITPKILDRVIADLGEQALRRIRLVGEPGAGASTIAARVAWDVYMNCHAPVAWVRRGGTGLLDAIGRLRDLVPRSFLVVAEEEILPVDAADRIFEQLQSRRVPAVLLFVQQRNLAEFHESAQSDRVQRVFQVKDKLDSPNELAEFRAKIRPYVATKQKKAFEDLADTSLFVNLLTAFEEQFIKLEKLVHDILTGATDDTLALLVWVVFCTRYAHGYAPTSFLKTVTGLSRAKILAALAPYSERLILVANATGPDPSFKSRHDLITEQLLQQLWAPGTREGVWKQQIPDRLVPLIKKLNFAVPGGEWQREFVSKLIVGNYGEVPTRIGSDRVSRLMFDIQSKPGRERIFNTVAHQFNKEPHFLAQYGRFLYDEDTQFIKSREWLQKAIDVSPSDWSLRHMMGMSYRRELHEMLLATKENSGAPEVQDMISILLDNARASFALTRQLGPENQYGYVSHIECLLDLVRAGFQRFPEDSPRHSILEKSELLRNWLDQAADILWEARVYIAYDEGSWLWKLEKDIDMLRGDISRTIEAFFNLLGKSQVAIDRNALRRSLAHCLCQRGMQQIAKHPNDATKDFQRAADLLSELIADEPTRAGNVSFWFQCARLDRNTNKRLLTERLENYYARTQSLEGAFYLMCLYFIRGMEENNPEAFRQYGMYRNLSSKLSSTLSHRLHRREWIGRDFNLIPTSLVPYKKESGDYDTGPLRRIPGKIKKIVSETQGYLSIPPYGEQILFQPHRREHKFYRSDQTKEVTFAVAFNNEGPIAYDVKLKEI
jgi:hypothetical protein